MKIPFKTLLITLLLSTFCNAQKLDPEVALFSGITSMQTDYGERKHFGSSYANIGFGVGAAFYLNFSKKSNNWNDRVRYFEEHFRLRLELSYMQTKLVHRGQYTEGNSPDTVLYNAMEGTSTILNYGAQIEYSIFDISKKQFFNPYVSVGFLANSNTPKLESSLGNIQTNTALIPNVYSDGLFLEKNNSTSLILGFGTRLQPKSYYSKSIYLIDFRLQRFNSDIIDGLKPNLSANKYDDWLLFFSVGYIFSFN
ncbi:MAG TPA: hypothetical protein EYG85_06015 [Crocinitomix sp.]|nr:hypothetical protein [Crocinitomix sp.]